MANRNMQSKLYSFEHKLTHLLGSVAIGATGAVTGLKGTGITSITRLAAGVYKIVLEDGYNRVLHFNAFFTAPVTGAAVNDGSLVVGTLYRIVTVGTSTFASYGAPKNEVGATFVATAIGGAGSGTVKAIGDSGIVSVEIANANLDTDVFDKTGFVITCVNDAGSVADPADGSKMYFNMVLRNSTITGKGE